MRSADPSLFPQGCDETERAFTVLHALPHCVDAGIVRLQRVVDEDTPFAPQARQSCDLGIRFDANGHHDQVRLELATIIEAHAADPFGAENGGGPGRHLEVQSPRFE